MPSYTQPDSTGERTIPIDDFYFLPGDAPQVEHPLAHGELITAIDLPPSPLAAGSLYLKFRDRQSYEFAMVSVCARLLSKTASWLMRAWRSAVSVPSPGGRGAPNRSCGVRRRAMSPLPGSGRRAFRRDAAPR